MEINSIDYHDFVIRNKELIGEFEQMYQKSAEIPWHQDKIEDGLDVRLAIQLLKQDAPFYAIADVSCGLGYFLDIMKRNLGSIDCLSYGFDVSITACKKASELFQNYKFNVNDLTENSPTFDATGKKSLFMIRGSLFYIYRKIRNAIDNLHESMSDGSILLVCQNFPPLNSNFIGKEIIGGPDSVENLFMNRFNLTRSLYVNEKISTVNNNWYIGVFRKGL